MSSKLVFTFAATLICVSIFGCENSDQPSSELSLKQKNVQESTALERSEDVIEVAEIKIGAENCRYAFANFLR